MKLLTSKVTLGKRATLPVYCGQEDVQISSTSPQLLVESRLSM